MRAVVHIGAPKTGSSSIQAFLNRNRAALASQGFRYERMYPHRGSQIEFAAAGVTLAGEQVGKQQRLRYSYPDMAAQHREVDALQTRLREGVATWPEETFVISAEHIIPWVSSDAAISALDGLLREHFTQVHYVLYLRRQEDLLASAYSERIKRGATRGFDAFITARLPSLNHHRVVRRWENGVGTDRLDVRLLDPTFLQDGDLLADFCTACGGIDMAQLRRPPRRNESLSAEAAEVLRIFNEHRPELRPDGSRDPVGKWLRQRLNAASRDGSRIALTSAQRARVRAAHAESIERLRRDFFPERAALFAPAAAPPEPRDISAIREDALRLASELLAQAAPSRARDAGGARAESRNTGAMARLIRRARRSAGRLVTRARPGRLRLSRI